LHTQDYLADDVSFESRNSATTTTKEKQKKLAKEHQPKIVKVYQVKQPKP
jgi:hypothetical protein